MKVFKQLILFTVLIIGPWAAYAEPCWMLGCRGVIGFMYIPRSQIDILPDQQTTILNDVTYTLDTSKRLLKEFGLPPVNSTVTLNVEADLILGSTEINGPSVQKVIDHDWYEHDKKTKRARIHQYRFKEASPMARGSRLRILGYTIAGGAYSGSALFATVLFEGQ